MIESIQIKNFKCIEGSGLIYIKPITLILGPNSSGKSSVLKPLLLMKQTADSRDIQRSVQVDGTYVSLGAFQEFVFNHNKDIEVKFTISFTPERTLMWRGESKRIVRELRGKKRVHIVRSLSEIIPDIIEVEVTFVMGPYEQTVTKETKYTVTDKTIGTLVIDKIRGARGAYSGFVTNSHEDMKFTPLKKSKFYDMSQSPKSLEYGTLPRSELGYNLSRLLNYVTRSFEMAISNIIYLGPLREEPAPLYGAASERPQDVGTAGEDAATVLWVGRGEKKQIELRRKVEKWMAEFEIAKNIKLHKLGPFFQVLLKDWHTGITCNLTEVGFGASQLLPVIVAGYYAPEKSIMIAEQPEIHLHPKAQTLLADLFIDISRENKKIIVETHSEHLLMRLQRRIVDGSIDSDMVSVYYCEPTRDGTKVRQIEINKYGQLGKDLPKGFFEEGYLETKEHFKAIVNKKAGEKSKERQ